MVDISVNINASDLAESMDYKDMIALAEYVRLDADDINNMREAADVSAKNLFSEIGYSELLDDISPDLVEEVLNTIHRDLEKFVSRACITGVKSFIEAYLEYEGNEEVADMLLKAVADWLDEQDKPVKLIDYIRSK